MARERRGKRSERGGSLESRRSKTKGFARVGAKARLAARSTANALRALARGCAAAALPAIFALAGTAESETLGKIDFPTSGAAAAQKHFEQGALLLHSFEYDDAAEEFQEAQQVEPGFAMAYWGEAMTYNKPLWMRLDQKAGQAVLRRLGETREARLAKAPTDREKGYLGAVDTLFFGEGEKATRDLAYTAVMERLSRRFPDDSEAAAFHALAVLGTAQGKRDFRIYMRAAALAQAVFDRNPRHPGAAHYLIHSFDDPTHAPLGLPAARVYAEIAPAAAHALHMPSHIFVALGMWERTAASNEDSSKAADDRVRRKGLTVKDRSYHALWWLQYTYLQQGRYEKARRLLDVMEQDVEQLSIPLTRRHLAAMRAHYVVETRLWDLEGLGRDLDLTKVRAEDATALVFVRGMAAVENGDLASAKKALVKLEGRVAELANKSGRASGLEATRATALQLKALLDLARGRERTGLESLRKAAAVEEAMPLAYGPPAPVKPSHELLGEVLLGLGWFEEAGEQFAKALERAPRRALSLLGAARAAARGGDRSAAEAFYAELRDVWSGADALPERAEVFSAKAEVVNR